MADPAPVIVIHSLAQAVAALAAAAAAGREIVVASAPGAGAYAGAAWFAALIMAARAAVPDGSGIGLLDCGDDPVAAMAAGAAGIERIVFTGRTDVAARLADIAAQRGLRLERERPQAALDLGDDFAAAAPVLRQRCAAFLTVSPRLSQESAIC